MGSATVAGYDVVAQRGEVRRNIGLVFQDTTLDTYLTAEQNLRFHAELYGVPKLAVADRMQQVLEMVGLWERRTSRVATFSGGMKRRLEIARGLLHSPRVLFLDEPTVGLDPQTRSSIWAYINELRQSEDITIFLTTHYMDEAEHCDRIGIIDQGKIVVLDTPEALKESVGKDRVQIQTADDARAIVGDPARSSASTRRCTTARSRCRSPAVRSSCLACSGVSPSRSSRSTSPALRSTTCSSPTPVARSATPRPPRTSGSARARWPRPGDSR